MPKFEIRKARQRDKKEILKLLSDRQGEANSIYGGKENFVLSKGPGIFDQIINEKHVITLVGLVNKQIVAVLTIYILPRIRSGGSFAIIEDVLVAKEFRRKGLGTRLMKEGIKICKNTKKIKVVKLGTRKNETGIHTFYERLKFKYEENLLVLKI